MNLSDTENLIDGLTVKRGGAMRVAELAGAFPRKLEYVFAEDIPDHDQLFDDELIEGVIGRTALCVLYGDSNSGKTFLAVDIAAAVCSGKRWMCRHTAQGLVLYLATEAPASVCNRALGHRRGFDCDLHGFVIVKSPIDLFSSQADVTAVLSLVQEIESEFGEKVALIIGDTLARISAGANENSGEDMSVVLRNVDAIKTATDATFLLIHHTGKDAARGMRGWSGLRAAIDTEIEITADDTTGIRTAEVTKQRDLPGKGTRIGFRLEPVHLGQNRWGTDRGTMYVVPADAPAKQSQARRPSEIAGAVVEFLNARGTGCMKGVIAKHFDGRYPSSSIYREITKMVSDGRLHKTGDLVVIAGKA